MSRICSPRIERNTFNLHEVLKKTAPFEHLKNPFFPLEICITFTRRDYSLIPEMTSMFIYDPPVSAKLYLKSSLQTLPTAELPLISLCSGSFLLCHHSVLSQHLSLGLESPKSARKQQTVFFLGFLQHSWRERRREITPLSAKGERKYSLQYTKNDMFSMQKSPKNIFLGPRVQ